MRKRDKLTLTKSVVDASAAASKRFHVWDSELAGFGLRVESTGVKTFIAKYRVGGGRTGTQRVVTIGRFGTLTADQARKEAKKILGGAAVGSDPSAEIQARRREMKMSALIDLYEAEGCTVQRGKRQGTPMKPMTKSYTVARLRHHVVPLLGAKRVSEIGAGDIERFFADVTAGKTARDDKIGPRRRIIVRGGAGAARKVFRDLSAVFSFARRREIIARNPCDIAAVQKTDGRNERYLTLPEVGRLGAALDALEREGVNPKGLNIARLWALTGCRRNEIAGLKWSEVDLTAGVLKFSDSKTGKSVRPLGAAAIALLQSLEQQEGSEFVFPSDRGDGHFQGLKTMWSKAIKRADLPGVSPHTLRHTLGSTATSTGEALALTGAILGHSNLRSTAIYAHVQHDFSKRAATRVTNEIAAALSGSSTVPNARDADTKLLQLIADRYTIDGAEGSRFRRALLETIAGQRPLKG